MDDKEHLIKYAVKLRAKGDRWREIEDYLYSKTDDKNLINEIMEAVEDADAKGLIKREKGMEVGPDYTQKILGFFMTACGISLTILLWDIGYVIIASIAMTAVGISALLGANIDPRDFF